MRRTSGGRGGSSQSETANKTGQLHDVCCEVVKVDVM